MKILKKAMSLMLACTLFTALAAVLPQTVQAAGVTYYVDSAGGNDNNNGTSSSTAWKTLSKVNSKTFSAGDKILLKAGGSWTGMLSPKGSGAAGNPITVDMYGTGNKPIINGGGILYPDAPVKLSNQSYWEIKNLEITNIAAGEADRAAVLVRSDNVQVNKYIHLLNLDIHDVKGDNSWGSGKSTGGIIVDCTVVGTRYDDVLVEGCTLKTVDRTGINVGWIDDSLSGQTGSANYNTNVVIRNNVLNDIGGDGIMVCHSKAPLVEYNVSQSANMRASTKSVQAGFACGMWPWSTDDAVFQFNEVYGQRWNEAEYIEYGIGEDGTAFDVDGFNFRSIHQYNYSHDNQGGFIMVCGNADCYSQNSIIRYNISQNDGDDLFDMAGPNKDTYIYNNVFYTKEGMNVLPYNFRDNGGIAQNTYSYNNIFYNLGTGKFVFANSVNTVFDYNVFYGNHLSGEPADAHKLTADPMFVNPGSGTTGLASLEGYKLQAASPCINSGKQIGSFAGISNGGKDFWGNPLYNGVPDRGVHEYTGTVVTPPTNLVVNPGFETGTTGWTVNYSNNSVVSNNYHDGTKALRVGTASGGRAQDITGVIEGKEYTLSAWGKVAAGASGYIGLDFINSSGTIISGAPTVELEFTGTSYVQKVQTFTVPSGTAKVQIYVVNGSGYFYADDISITAN